MAPWFPVAYKLEVSIYDSVIHLIIARYMYEEVAFNKGLQFFVWIVFPTIMVCFSVGFTHIVGPNAIG